MAQHNRSFYTEHDWKYTNELNIKNADTKCSTAEHLVSECRKMCHLSDENAELQKKEVDFAFDQRIKEVNNLKKEVANRIDALNDEVDKLHVYKHKLQDALTACEQPLYISQQCQQKRKSRQGIDHVYDEPERQLEREISLIQDAQNIIRHTIEEINEQLRLNEVAIKQLNRDVADKGVALGVDLRATAVKPLTASLEPVRLHGIGPGSRESTVEEWESNTNMNIRKAEEEIKRSRKLYPVVDDILSRTSSDIKQQHERVTKAMEVRVQEARKAKEEFETRLSKVTKQMNEVDHTLSQIKFTSSHKIPMLSVAQKKLQTRRQRPNVENCRDQPLIELEKEVKELEKAISILQQKEYEAREMLRVLLQNKRSLEEEIRIKTNTLYIDEVQCLSLLSGPVVIPH